MPTRLTRWYPAFYLLLNSLALTVAGLAAIAANADFQSSVRTALTVSIFILAALSLLAGFWLLKNETKAGQLTYRISHLKHFNLLLALFFGAAWGLAWLPAEKSGTLYYYFVGVQPLLAWAAFASGLGLLLGLSLRPDFSLKNGRAYWLEHKTSLLVSFVALVLFGLIAALIAWLKIWQIDEPYWYGAGAPLLAWQVYLVGLAVLLFRKVRVNWPRQADLLLFFAIWAITAVFWVRQPLQTSFFFTPPTPPNLEFYPFADLEFFDQSSQYALLGQGINNGMFFDRTLYIAFLVYLHTFFGQNYELLMSIQAGLFAVLPAVIYLIAKNLDSRPAGLVAAALAGWRGVNALAGMALINSSTAKHMLTDFPTGLGLAISCLFLVQWLRDPQKQWPKAAWAAGTLGLTSLLRPHVMAILLVLLPVILLVSLPKWRRGLALVCLSILAFFASIGPWTFLSGNSVSIIDLYATRIRGVIEQRYVPQEEKQIPAIPPAKAGLLALAHPAEPPVELPFVISQFLNNLQTSALGLPLSPQLLTLKETVKSGEAVWQTDWQGDLSVQGGLMLTLGLALTALGIGAGVQKSFAAGLALPLVFVIYAAANALARTSGGRYIVPIDWIVILFFGLGLTVILEAGEAFFKRQTASGEPEQPAPRAGRQPGWGLKAFGLVACFGLIGGLIPFSQTLNPRRYQPATQEELVEKFVGLGLERAALQEFLKNENAFILQGAALYPRYFHQNEGHRSWPPYQKTEYPRTIFVLIGPQPQAHTIVLAGLAREYFPHNSDVLVLFCEPEKADALDASLAALVVALPGPNIVYQTQPERPLACPVAKPICNNNKSCR